MTNLRTFEQIRAEDVDLVGGKGLSLGLMAQGGLPVPPGFCITSTAFRTATDKELSSSLAAEIGSAYRQLGGGLVAVRSSATVEDGAVASFAGQQETILGVQGEAAVYDAVVRCWGSLHAERASAYRRKQGVDDKAMAMAVVVQRLVPAEAAGVLFTRDPLDPQGKRMLIEAAWGLGEAVVSGRVAPDRWHLDREDGTIRDRHISTKTIEINAEGAKAVASDRQNQPCLDDAQLAALAALGRKVEAFYGDARDVEWALADGKFWLLQARPITTADAFEREQVRREEIAVLATMAATEGTVWSKFNLSEILPEPTPMTWAIIRRFMSGKGGFGLMYRDLGFDPDPALDDEGIFDLVCGRLYCNLSREPRMHFRALPFEHPFAVLKADPRKALYPQPVLNPAKLGWKFWLFLPIALPRVMARMARTERVRQELSKGFAKRFREEIVPQFVREAEEALHQDLADFGPNTLIQRLDLWIWRTLMDFARESLKPTALALLTMGNLERKLTQTLGAERAGQAVRELIMNVHPDPEADLPAAFRQLNEGQLETNEFLARFGHRGSHEMELAEPRWSETGILGNRRTPGNTAAVMGATPDLAWDRIAVEAKLPTSVVESLRKEVHSLHTWIALRETAKHHLMRGYAVIRRLLVELDKRFRLNGGIFYLTPEELPRLKNGEDLGALIAQRRKRRTLQLQLEMPAVLFSDDLEAIGRQAVIEGAATLQGTPLSAGVAEAPALVLTEPTGEPPTGPYVLVCPTTDPAWVPLFAGAKALVMETGGVLSHGAIVAREFGLPAVAGIAGAQKILKTGQSVRVDGTRGIVTLLDSVQ